MCSLGGAECIRTIGRKYFVTSSCVLCREVYCTVSFDETNVSSVYMKQVNYFTITNAYLITIDHNCPIQWPALSIPQLVLVNSDLRMYVPIVNLSISQSAMHVLGDAG